MTSADQVLGSFVFRLRAVVADLIKAAPAVQGKNVIPEGDEGDAERHDGPDKIRINRAGQNHSISPASLEHDGRERDSIGRRLPAAVNRRKH